MADRVLRIARGAGRARGVLLAGGLAALGLAAGLGLHLRSSTAPVPAAPVLVAVPVALAPAPARSLVLVPAGGSVATASEAATRDAANPQTAGRDPLAIDPARLARAHAVAVAARNRVAAVPAAPRPADARPGPRLTRPAALAAFDAPDPAPAAPPPVLRLAPAAEMAMIAAAPVLPPQGRPLADAPPLPDRALRPAPPRPAATDTPTTRLAAATPKPRPEALPILAAAAPAAVPAAMPAPPRAEPVLPLAEPALGPGRAEAGACRKVRTRAIPARSAGAPGGQAFLASLGGVSGPERDARIVAELSRGNLPDALRALRPVRLTGTDAAGRPVEIVICVMPDYLALGSDRDQVRVPLGLPGARAVAGRFGMLLPTPRMVDAIWAQADVRLSPAPMPAGPQMSSTGYFLRHNATIEGQLGRQSGLVSGHKKDVVLASRMAAAPGRVAIYGWHRRSGEPIQPVSTVHGASYSDYSHGIRLVARTAFVNGRAAELEDLLASDLYARVLNPDGPLAPAVIRLAAR